MPSPQVMDMAEAEGIPPFHLKQVYDWIFARQAETFAAMSNVPAAFRERLAREFTLHPLGIRKIDTSRMDGTARYFFNAHDADPVQTVYLPEKDRYALCLSSQVGCAYRCGFCASGLVPFKRQLSAAEIVDQVLRIQKDRGTPPASLLFMGMGEPLANYAQVRQALHWFTSKNGMGMSPSRITLSTSGLVPQIRKLIEDGVKVQLAVSLHSVRDEIRREIMPVSGKFRVRELIKSARDYHRASKADVTFEYILLEGVNDTMTDAIRLTYLTQTFPNHVNLIPYNPVPGLPYRRPSDESVERFHAWLRQRGVKVFVRKPKGLDIGSACGQLGPARAH